MWDVRAPGPITVVLLRAEATLAAFPLCTSAAPASSIGISTITARTTVHLHRPAASEGENGRGIAGRAQEQMRCIWARLRSYSTVVRKDGKVPKAWRRQIRDR